MTQAVLLCPEVCLGVQLHTISPEARVSQLLKPVTCVVFSCPLRWALQATHFGSGALFMGTTNPCKPLLHDVLFVLCLPCGLLGSPPLTPRRLANSCKDAFTKFLSLWDSCLFSVLWHLLLVLWQNLWHDEGKALLWTCHALLRQRYHKEVLDTFPHLSLNLGIPAWGVWLSFPCPAPVHNKTDASSQNSTDPVLSYFQL